FPPSQKGGTGGILLGVITFIPTDESTAHTILLRLCLVTTLRVGLPHSLWSLAMTELEGRLMGVDADLWVST
ncbi:hypothetical protein MELA_02452, partial [Candidatus Methylomirabilis lanthanidiphila]